MKYLGFIIIFLGPFFAWAKLGDTAFIGNHQIFLLNNKQITYFEDSSNNLSLNEVKENAEFKNFNGRVPNKGVSASAYWLKFLILNNSDEADLMICIKNPNLGLAQLYSPDSLKDFLVSTSGSDFSLSQRQYNSQFILFNVKIPKGKAETFYLKIKSHGQLIIPVYVGTEKNILTDLNRDNLFFGLYGGIILVMFFYNLFVYFSVKDNVYLYYVIYILSVGFAQFTLQGFGYRFLWNESRYIVEQSINWVGALSGISVALFVRSFLQTAKITPLFHKFLSFCIATYCISIGLTIFEYYDVAYTIIDLVALIGCIFIWIMGLYLSIKGLRAAQFFIVAWSFFLLAIIIYVLKDFGIIQYNLFTNTILLSGSALEVTLLSFALADKINSYKKEKELSQAEALKVSKENEQLIKEQNIVLEKRVAERTEELETTNHELSKTLTDLKDAQTQLVEAEKMASLGQLTAGIAHEINNPINFVKSNIKPLKLDIKDLFSVISEYEKLHHTNNGYKELLEEIGELKNDLDLEYIKVEIQNLISGIEEGAERTAEIVRGLRIFSRVDEGELKVVSVHEGLDSTVVLLKNTLPHHIQIVKNYQAEGNIECYPGKLNQVFMNIINNGVQAITSKKTQNELEYITILTKDIGDNRIEISIKDSGMGMTEETKQKIFEPFFTTKDVGEGTGLGMAIVFKIIEKHSGTIQIESTPGNGAEFRITLPYVQTFAKSY